MERFLKGKEDSQFFKGLEVVRQGASERFCLSAVVTWDAAIGAKERTEEGVKPTPYTLSRMQLKTAALIA